MANTSRTAFDITPALVAGLERAQRLGFTKPHDIATAIRVELSNAGLKIVKAPTPKAS